ncbi:hypothetical protein BSY17_250 [Sphingobium sp. RAC03]|nr:hypothetical protein BSY17_250 [Sphingobium sp. RAC03]
MAHSPLRADSAPANPVGRRDVLAALALSQIALVPTVHAIAPAALASGRPLPAATNTADAHFWHLHAQRLKVDAAWEACLRTSSSDMSDHDFDDWGARHHEAERAMMVAPIATLPALRAKLAYMKSGELDVLEGDEHYPAPIDLVLRDMDHILGNGEAAQ